MDGCLEEEGTCVAECSLELPTPNVKVPNVCQKNCGIDFGKCLIQTFEMESCLKVEAVCVLDCLKDVKVAHVSKACS